jgi:8-oxo-dGTP diphosphatase
MLRISLSRDELHRLNEKLTVKSQSILQDVTELKNLTLNIIRNGVDKIAPDDAANTVDMPLKRVVRAAGGVISRPGTNGDTEVLLIYRIRQQGDWTFPKGKLEAGEAHDMCALREVLEETGLLCALDEELPSVSYRDGKGQLKIVRYWAMRILSGVARPCNEVAAVRWFSIEAALTQLTYTHDRELLAAFANLLSAGYGG